MDSEKKGSVWNKKVSLWHIVYLFVICLIVNVFLLCIAPGRINDDAYHNFTFAATITSIVLAVVSIVYSIQSGLSSYNQLNGIRDIETQIGQEINKFSNLESSIKTAVTEIINPLQASMGDIQQKQCDLQKAQDEFAKNWKSYVEAYLPVSVVDEKSPKHEKSLLETTDNVPQIFAIILYTCKKCKETSRDIPYHILGKYFGPRSYYCEGVISCLSVFKPEALSIGIGSKSTRQTIIKYDERLLGTESQLKNLVRLGKNKDLGENILADLELFFIRDEQSID